jgi:Zn-dependent peptidase ImmA (M78 family)
MSRPIWHYFCVGWTVCPRGGVKRWFGVRRPGWRIGSGLRRFSAAVFLGDWLCGQSEPEQAEYAEVQKWWSRHALRAADPSALFPDVVLRRLVNDIEISWTARQPAYAPDGFRFALAPGVAILPIDDVAPALWAALGIRILDERLQTSTIRGVAVAGSRYHPAILVNWSSPYNAEEPGRRFTLAHEFFHVLYDRERAKRISHTSGPWAPPGIEKRANAFAAMLLMPRDLVRRSLPEDALDSEGLRQAAQTMQVGATALIEHLYNISMIEEIERDELRASLLPLPID